MILPPLSLIARHLSRHLSRRLSHHLLHKCLWLLAVPCLFSIGLWLWLVLAPAPPLLEGIAFSPLVLDRADRPLRIGLTPDEKYRIRVRLHDIAPDAVRAALRYEDQYFYTHPGVNPFALGRAALHMVTGGRKMGGSTLTMQLARLRLGLETTTLRGKMLQILRALQLEYHYSKQDILEAYFNLAPYGGNVEGIGAAARLYFHTTPARLTFSECMALTGIPQNPGRRSPWGGADFHAARTRLHSLWDKSTVPPLRVRSSRELPFAAPHLATELLAASTQGQPVRSWIDRPLQKLLENGLHHFTARGRRYGLNNASALLIHWPTMEVRALVGSADFHNTAISGQVDGTKAKRSPGSTLKPFIYALALDQSLIHPRTLLPDSPRSYGGYDPENFDRSFRGPLPASTALLTSRNLPALGLAARLQPSLYEWLQRAGVGLSKSEEHYGLSLVLGGAEMSMRELGTLYAMLANKGVARTLRRHRDEVEPAALPLLSPEAAILTLRMLEDENHSLNTRSGSLPLRFKTGTSNGFRDAWTVGIVGPYVLGVWVGNFDNTANPLLVGADTAAPLFIDLAQSLALREATVDLIPAQQEGLTLSQVEVCAATGDLDTSLCTETATTWFIPGRSPTRASGILRTILIDTKTGLRVCGRHRADSTQTGRVEEQVWEFWPSDLRAQFIRAGIVKPVPPPLAPDCAVDADATLSGKLGGRAPAILIPKENVIYQRRLSDPARSTIALTASLDADAHSVYWFAGDRFLGQSDADTPLVWLPDDGKHELRAIDDLGRASRRLVRVRTHP